MKKVRVGINGFGRIGRAFYRLAHDNPNIEVVAINDLGKVETLAYLLQRDTVYGKAKFMVTAKDGNLMVDGNPVKILAEKDATKIPWASVGADVIVESTGVYDSFDKARAHLTAGAKRVVITAPAHDEEGTAGGATVLMGVNEDKLKTCELSSNASCTTNAGSPLIAILDKELGIEHALLNTTHAYTASQSLVDGVTRAHNQREFRAGAMNLVPTSTGAAIAVTRALPMLDQKFDGISIRAPIVCGSIVDVTFVAKRTTTAEEVNALLRKAAADPKWEGVFGTTDEELVSSDIIGTTYGSLADLSLTRVVGGTLVKVCAWYDNEMGYTSTLVRHVLATGQYV